MSTYNTLNHNVCVKIYLWLTMMLGQLATLAIGNWYTSKFYPNCEMYEVRLNDLYTRMLNVVLYRCVACVTGHL